MNDLSRLLDQQEVEPVLLLGPGPLSVSQRVLRAMSRPLLGYLDVDFKKMLAAECDLIRKTYNTTNAVTFALSGTGMAGMECAISNLLEPGEKLLVGVHGFFGDRMCEVAARHGAEVHRVDTEWGRPLDLEALSKAARAIRPRVIAAVHAETSTGCLLPLAEVGGIARDAGSMLIADCVTSLGGVPVDLDACGVDVAYAGSQKCLGAPPGLAPVSFSARAMEKIRARKTKPGSWYHDVALLERYYFGEPAGYHHTPSNSMHYGLIEALRITHEEEGLAQVMRRHDTNHRAFVAGVEALGLRLLVPAGFRTPMLNSFPVPDGVDEAKVRARLRAVDRIEVGAGLGKLRGKILRVGLMGHASRRQNVLRVLPALASAMREQGFACSSAAALEAAEAVYAQN